MYSRVYVIICRIMMGADGKHESTKTKLEGIDEKKRSFSYKVIEGDAMN